MSNDNPYSEARFKTIKDAREWVCTLVDCYNNKHYHSGINFLTPNSRHNGQDEEIMRRRKELYKSARKLDFQRFNKGILNGKLLKSLL
ncbi:MAG: hypothetical protein N4A48_00660 [Tepidibacter sp.]|uniref:hypothetical protein n=1 Tax=Tepidibacter sp. TaxID=2529387 RepID=UPI0025D628D4|nr:hypothetical protein [Tepidibacter sp.]MCT4507269.1 hypothetical protein [Tepidibacter sp.]